ncbi:MAG: TIGR04002 family protein [Clostridiales bacterium]|nr:TIGR04002 family protein [Clostridiales bacterium]
MKKDKVLKICLTGLMAAIIAVFTAFVKMPTGINSGYLHFGDSMIYLAGCLLGPFSVLSASIGGALADILSGAPVWAIPTAIIKILNVIPFIIATGIYKKKKKKEKIINIYTVLMTILSGIITVFGYYIAEGLLYSFPTALTSIPFSIIQALGSGILFIIVGFALDAVKIQKYLKR